MASLRDEAMAVLEARLRAADAADQLLTAIASGIARPVLIADGATTVRLLLELPTQVASDLLSRPAP